MPKVTNRRSEKVKKFLRDVCVAVSHDFNLETLRCERCGSVPFEDVMVYSNGLLMHPIHDYHIDKNKVTFVHIVPTGSTITVVVTGKETVRTTIRVHRSSHTFKFRRTK